MADTTALKNRIRAAIKANDNQEITGPVLQQALLDIVDELNEATEAEALIRSNADATLQQNITAEKNRAEEVENTLQQDIITEKNRAKEVDSILQQSITIEKSRAEGAENTLQQNITAEQIARQQEDTQLSNLIADIKSSIDNGYMYAGIATPSTVPMSGKVFYVAMQAGTYTNFDDIIVAEGITILKYDGTSWTKEHILSINIAIEFEALGKDLNLLTRTGTEITGTPATNLEAPVDFIAGDIFYINEGTDGGNYSIYVDGIRYYIAKVSGIAGSSLIDSDLFDNAYSSAEAIRLSLKYNGLASKNITNEEMDDVLGGEVAVYLTDADNKAVLDDEGKPIEII